MIKLIEFHTQFSNNFHFFEGLRKSMKKKLNFLLKFQFKYFILYIITIPTYTHKKNMTPLETFIFISSLETVHSSVLHYNLELYSLLYECRRGYYILL
jgi:hypothetical protein